MTSRLERMGMRWTAGEVITLSQAISRIPLAHHHGIMEFLVHGFQGASRGPGLVGFEIAVLANDFVALASRAQVEGVSGEQLADWARLCHTLPLQCWGSYEAVENWPGTISFIEQELDEIRDAQGLVWREKADPDSEGGA